MQLSLRRRWHPGVSPPDDVSGRFPGSPRELVRDQRSWEPWFENPAQRVRVCSRQMATSSNSTRIPSPTLPSKTEADTYSSEHMRRAPLPRMSAGAIVEEVETT